MFHFNKLTIKNSTEGFKSNMDLLSCTMKEDEVYYDGFNLSDDFIFNNEPMQAYNWEDLSTTTHPLDNLLDIAPSSIKQYYLENPPAFAHDSVLDEPLPTQSEPSFPDTLVQSPRTLPSVLDPEFEKNPNQKQSNLLASPNNLQHFSLQHEENGTKENKNNNNDNKTKCAPPPALIFNIEKPKKRPNPSETLNDEANPMVHYYNEIMRNSKKKYRDMSPLSNIDGSEKYVDGIIEIPDEIPEDQIDKFNDYSKLNFICKKCGKTFALLKACTYYNGGLCCVSCCSFIHRETIGLYDYMKDLYFEDEKLYKCDRIIHYRPLWQFLKFEKKKKTWKIAKLCIYCRNLKSWEYLNKPMRRRKTIQLLENEKSKKQRQQQQIKKSNNNNVNDNNLQHNIQSLNFNPINNSNMVNDCCCNSNSCCDIAEMEYHNDNNIVSQQPPKKKAKKNIKPKRVTFDYDEDDDYDYDYEYMS